MFPPETIRKILARLDPVGVLQAIGYRAETIQDHGTQLKCFCPIHKEAVLRSMVLRKSDNSFKCSYSLCPGAQGGDLIKLYELSKKVSYDDAARKLVELFKLNVDLPTPDEYIDELMAQADTSLKAGDYAKAEAEFRKAQGLEKGGYRARRGLYRTMLRAGQATMARASLLELVESANAAGHAEEARSAIEEHLTAMPDDIDVRRRLIELLRQDNNADELAGHYMALAEHFESEKRIDEALEMYRSIDSLGNEVIDVFPHMIHLLASSGRGTEAVSESMKRADKLEAQNQGEAAFECLRNALKIDPARDDVRQRVLDLAIAGNLAGDKRDAAVVWTEELLQRGRGAQSLDALERMAAILPKDEEIAARKLAALLKSGKLEQAEQAWLEEAERLVKSKKLEDALAKIEAGIETLPGSRRLMQRKAALEAKLGNKALAVETLSELARSLLKAKDPREAMAACDEGLQLIANHLGLLELRLSAIEASGDAEAAAEASLVLADRLLEAGRADDAIARIDDALSHNPNNPQLYLRRAVAAERAGKGEEALASQLLAIEIWMTEGEHAQAAKELQEILRQSPNTPEALDRLASCQMELGDATQAADTLRQLADAHEAQTEWAKAEPLWRRLIEMEPGEIESQTRLATALEQMGRAHEAVAALRGAAARYLEEKAYSQAETVCRRLLQLDENDADAIEMLIRINEASRKAQTVQTLYTQLAEVYRKKDDAANERKTLEAILARWPAQHDQRKRLVMLLWDQQDLKRVETETRFLVDAWGKLRKFDEAETLLLELRKRASAEPVYLELLAELYEQAGKPEKWESAARDLAALARRRNQFASAADWSRKIIARQPDDMTLRADLIGLLLRDNQSASAAEEYMTLARLHEGREGFEDAESAYEAALELDGTREDAKLALIRLRIQMHKFDEAMESIRDMAGRREANGDTDGAIEAWRQSFEIDRESIEARRKIIEIRLGKGESAAAAEELELLVKSHERREEWDAALAVRREVIAMLPDSPEAREALSNLLDRLNRRDEWFAADIELSQFYMARNKPDKAIKILDRLAKEDPDSIRARRLRAEALAKNGEEKKALEEFLSISARLEAVWLAGVGGNGERSGAAAANGNGAHGSAGAVEKSVQRGSQKVAKR